MGNGYYCHVCNKDMSGTTDNVDYKYFTCSYCTVVDRVCLACIADGEKGNRPVLCNLCIKGVN